METTIELNDLHAISNSNTGVPAFLAVKLNTFENKLFLEWYKKLNADHAYWLIAHEHWEQLQHEFASWWQWLE